MNNFNQMNHYMVKQEHSQVYTLKSINSSQEILQFVPVYYRRSQSSQCKSGHWSAKEHIKYVMFLDYFQHIFTVKHNIKLWKIFTIMSSFIKTRNSSQCRSHHQKTERKLRSIESILRIQKAKYCNYENQYQKMKEMLSKLPIHNPAEVQVKQQSIDNIPSLKLLQEEIQYPVMKNSISLVDMNEMEKSQKSHKNFGSERIIHYYPSQRCIASQVSIQMEHQNDELSQQMVKQLMYEELEAQYEKQQQFWIFGNSQGDNSQKKDEKFDRTADSAFNDAIKTYSQQKPKHDSLPQKLSANQQQDEIPTVQTLKGPINLVRKKRSRTRSLLPSYDIVENEAKAQHSQFYKESKRDQLYTPDGKCKTLPPRSVKGQNDESQINQQNQNNQPVLKSFFSEFISSFAQGNEELNENAFGHQQHNNQNYYCEKKQQSNDDFRLKIEQNERSNCQREAQQNILFCDYGMKGNIQDGICYGQQGENEDSFNFIPPKALKRKLKSQENGPFTNEIPKMNFSKKSAQQIEKAFKQEQVRQPEQNYHVFYEPDRHQSNPPEFYHPHTHIHDGHFSHHNYQTYYYPYILPPEYSILHHNYQQFMYFYIYFLIQKIQMSHIFYDPN